MKKGTTWEGTLGIEKAKELKEKMSKRLKGKPISNEHREKIRLANKGKKSPWTRERNLKNNPMKNPEVVRKVSKKLKGRKYSEKVKRKMSDAKKGKKNSFYGKHHTKETKEKLRKANKGNIPTTKGKTLEEFFGKKEGKKLREKFRLCNSGKRNPNWRGGISREPYPFNFKKISIEIRKRDNYICQLCKNKIVKQTKKKFLTAHHIDYNKKNNDFNNLITLCNSCNAIVNKSREQWTNFFQNNLYKGLVKLK